MVRTGKKEAGKRACCWDLCVLNLAVQLSYRNHKGLWGQKALILTLFYIEMLTPGLRMDWEQRELVVGYFKKDSWEHKLKYSSSGSNEDLMDSWTLQLKLNPTWWLVGSIERKKKGNALVSILIIWVNIDTVLEDKRNSCSTIIKPLKIHVTWNMIGNHFLSVCGRYEK